MSKLHPHLNKLLGIAVFSLILIIPAAAFAADWDVVWEQSYDDPGTTDSAGNLFVEGNNLYVVGTKTSGYYTALIRIEKRSATTGDIIWAVEENPTNNDDNGSTIFADTQGVYVGAVQNVVGGGNFTGGAWRIEKRNPSTGSLIWTQVIDPTGYSDFPNKMFVASGKLYILGVQGGGSGSSPPNNWRIEERSVSDGTLSWSTVYKAGSDGGYPFGFGTDGTSLYTTGRYDSGTVDFQCIIEKRSMSSGSIIWTKYYNPSSIQDECRALTTGSDGFYVVGTEGNNDVAAGMGSNLFVQKRGFSDGMILWQDSVSPTNFLGVFSVANNGNGVYVSHLNGLVRRDANSGTLLSSYGSQLIRALDSDSTSIYGIAPSFFALNQWKIMKLGFDSLGPPPVCADIVLGSQTWAGCNATQNPQYWYPGVDATTVDANGWPYGALYDRDHKETGVCSAGYHVPSVDEWKEALQTLGITVDLGAKITNPLYPGYFFYVTGNSFDPGNYTVLRNALKLPFSGHYNFGGSGTYTDKDVSTSYWSNEQFSILNFIGTAVIRFFTPPNDHFNGMYHLAGLPLRCIADSVAPPSSTLKVCKNSCMSNTQRTTFSLAQNTSENLVACYNAASNCNAADNAGNVTLTSTWAESGTDVVTLSNQNVASLDTKKFQAGIPAGTETVTVTYGTEPPVILNATVSCTATNTCATDSQRDQVCTGTSYTIDNGCGSAVTCPGTRYCDFNWREVAP